MNAPFRIAGLGGDQELEKKFIEEAAAKGMIQLKGHRLVIFRKHMNVSTSLCVCVCMCFFFCFFLQCWQKSTTLESE